SSRPLWAAWYTLAGPPGSGRGSSAPSRNTRMPPNFSVISNSPEGSQASDQGALRPLASASTQKVSVPARAGDRGRGRDNSAAQARHSSRRGVIVGVMGLTSYRSEMAGPVHDRTRRGINLHF